MSDWQLDDRGPRNVNLAMWRGLCGRCPNCGKGKLFGSFLKVVAACSVCGTALHHYNAAYNAELAPAFLVQSVVSIPVGIACVVLASNSTWGWSQIAAVLGSLTIILSIAPLQPTKGAIVGLQWARRLDEFGGRTGGVPWMRDLAVDERMKASRALGENEKKEPSNEH